MKTSFLVAALAASVLAAQAQWTEGPDLKGARTGHTSTTLLDRNILVVGGYDNNGNCLKTAEIYDPNSNVWTATSALTFARCHHAAVLVDDGTGRVFVTGGLSDNGTALASTEFFDPVTNSWTTSPDDDMKVPRAHHASIRLARGDVLVIGGFDPAVGYLSSVEQFRVDTATSPWNPVGDLKFARAYHTATLLPNDRILVVGGIGNDTLDVSSGELCSNLVYCTWVVSANTLTTAHHGHIAVLLPSGDVLIAGGLGAGVALFTSELYDNTHFREIAGELSNPRYEFAAVLLFTGEVLAVGGRFGPNAADLIDAIEIYNPTQRRWTRGGLGSAIDTARAGLTAATLPNGVVIIAGGTAQRQSALVTTELFDPVPLVKFL